MDLRRDACFLGSRLRGRLSIRGPGSDQPANAANAADLSYRCCSVASASLMLTRYCKSVIGAHFVKLGDASLPIYLLHSFTLALIPRAMRSIGVQSPLIKLVTGLAIGVYLSWGIYLIVLKVGLDGLLGFNAKRCRLAEDNAERTWRQ